MNKKPELTIFNLLNNVSNEKWCKLFGLSKSELKNLKKNNNLSGETLIRACHILGVTPTSLNSLNQKVKNSSTKSKKQQQNVRKEALKKVEQLLKSNGKVKAQKKKQPVVKTAPKPKKQQIATREDSYKSLIKHDLEDMIKNINKLSGSSVENFFKKTQSLKELM